MRYATTTEDHEVLHRQDAGSTGTLCGVQALYDLDADTAAYGLMTGSLATCGECDMAAVRRAPTHHGFRAANAKNEDVRAAVRTLAVGGHEPARNPDEYGTRARGFLVEPAGESGAVVVYRMHQGLYATGVPAETVLTAYAHTLRIAGWHTSDLGEAHGVTGFLAHRPAEENQITTVTGEEPGKRPS